MSNKNNIVIEQGADFEERFQVIDENNDLVDLTNYIANSHIKKWYTSSSTAAVFNTSISLDTSEIVLHLYANQTSLIPDGRYVYDIKLINTSSNSVSRFAEGIATITPMVTI